LFQASTTWFVNSKKEQKIRAKNATGIDYEPCGANFRCRWKEIKFNGKRRRGKKGGRKGEEEKEKTKKEGSYLQCCV
jgi:hypothetical protein